MAALTTHLQTAAGKVLKQQVFTLRAAMTCMQALQMIVPERTHCSMRRVMQHANRSCQTHFNAAAERVIHHHPQKPKQQQAARLRSCLQRGGAAGVLALHGAHVRLKPLLAPVLQQLCHGHLLTILPSPHALAIFMQVPMHCASQQFACTFCCACLKTLRGRSRFCCNPDTLGHTLGTMPGWIT